MMTEPRPRALDADETDALQAIGWRPTSGSPHPDSSLLLAADQGVLDDAIASGVREHLSGCASCQLLVKDLASVMDEELTEGAAARIRSRIPDRPGAPRVPSTAAWIGGGVLALAAGVLWFLMTPRTASPIPAPETRTARVTPPTSPTVFVVDRPTIPPGDVDLTVRGVASTRISLENQIAAALDKADKSDLSGAASDLGAIVKSHPSSRIALLAEGAVQLRANQNSEAAATLAAARSLKGDRATSDEAGWFQAIALVRSDRLSEARSILGDVCAHGGPRSASACAGVAEIDRRTSGK